MDNGTDSSTLYNGDTGAIVPLRVGVVGAPTGIVFNGTASFFAEQHGLFGRLVPATVH